MEIRLSLLMLAVVAALLLGRSAHGPQRVEASAPRAELAKLEDGFATNPTDSRLAEELMKRYLRAGQPRFAIAAFRSADPAVWSDPLLSHRLAQAYEASGRLNDALATAYLALARCHRAIGSDAVLHVTEPPRFGCGAATLAALEVHRDALWQMKRIGVTDPRYDHRAEVARQVADRRATFRTASLD